MTIDGRVADIKELQRASHGDDTPPLMSLVPEPPPSHWGTMTSQSRTLSPQYIRFLKQHKEVRDVDAK